MLIYYQPQSKFREIFILKLFYLLKVKTFSYLDEELKTETMKNTLTPSWEKEFTLDLCKSQTNIQLSLFDWDRFSKHESLGRITINTSELIHKTMSGPKWFELKDCRSGSILLSLRMVGVKEDPQSSMKGVLLCLFISYFILRRNKISTDWISLLFFYFFFFLSNKKDMYV